MLLHIISYQVHASQELLRKHAVSTMHATVCILSPQNCSERRDGGGGGRRSFSKNNQPLERSKKYSFICVHTGKRVCTLAHCKYMGGVCFVKYLVFGFGKGGNIVERRKKKKKLIPGYKRHTGLDENNTTPSILSKFTQTLVRIFV